MSGARVTLAGQWAKYALQLGGILVLARVVSPAEYGTFAAVMSVAGVALVMCDFGLSVAAMSAPNISRQSAVNLSWANGVLGVVLALVIGLSGPGLSSIFNTDVVGLTVLISLTIVGQALIVQPKAMAARAGQYGWVALSDVMSQAVGLAVALTTALMGFGSAALAMQLLVAAWVSLALVAARSPIPAGLPRRDPSTRRLFGVGRNTAASQALNFASTNAGQFGLGWLNSTLETGYYNRALQLAVIPMQQIASPLTRVALPTLARLRERPDELIAKLSEAQLVLCYLLFAPCAVFIAVPDLVVNWLLGPDWITAALPLRVLAIGIVAQATTYVFYWAFIARDRTGSLFLIEAVGRGVMIVGGLLAAPYGAPAVAGAIALGQVVTSLISLVFGSRALGLPVLRIVMPARRPFFLYCVAGFSAALGYSLGASALGASILAALGFLLPIALCAFSSTFRVDASKLLRLARGNK